MKLKDLFEETEKNLIGVKIEMTDPTSNNDLWKGDYNCESEQLNSLKGAPHAVTGSFICRDNNLTTLEYGPRKVSGSYLVSSNQLTSLEHSPEYINEDYNCNNNKLSSLVGAPSKIGYNFNCEYNQITSLEGAPKEIEKDFCCGANELTSLKDIHKHIKKVGRILYMDLNPIKSHVLGVLLISGCKHLELSNDGELEHVMRIVNKYLPNDRGHRALAECQDELIEAGYEDYAQI